MRKFFSQVGGRALRALAVLSFAAHGLVAHAAQEEPKAPFVLMVVQWMAGGEAKIQTTEFATQESCEGAKEFLVQALEAMAAKRDKAAQIGYALKCNKK